MSSYLCHCILYFKYFLVSTAPSCWKVFHNMAEIYKSEVTTVEQCRGSTQRNAHQSQTANSMEELEKTTAMSSDHKVGFLKCYTLLKRYCCDIKFWTILI